MQRRRAGFLAVATGLGADAAVLVHGQQVVEVCADGDEYRLGRRMRGAHMVDGMDAPAPLHHGPDARDEGRISAFADQQPFRLTGQNGRDQG